MIFPVSALLPLDHDPALGVEWPLLPGVPLNLSQKDTKHPSFQEYKAARGL